MRQTFLEVRDERLAKLYGSTSRKLLMESRLSVWPEVVAHIRSEYRDQIGKFFEDAKLYAERDNVMPHRVHFPRYEVQLPSDKLPIFYEKQSVGATRGYDTPEVSYATVNYFGWATHEFKEGVDPQSKTRKKAYTQGLWIGGATTKQDYESGLLELMTAQRFVDIFGENALQDANWRFSKDLCRWAKPNICWGSTLPKKFQGLLLGVNRIAPKADVQY